METKDNNMNENRNKALNCLRFMTNFDNLEFYTPSYPQNRLPSCKKLKYLDFLPKTFITTLRACGAKFENPFVFIQAFINNKRLEELFICIFKIII